MYGALIGYDSLPVSAYDEAARQKPCRCPTISVPFISTGFCEASSPPLSAKAFLATEQRIPGLGNGVLQDILFRAGVHPKRAVSSLSSADQDALFGSVKTTLREMAEAGGPQHGKRSPRPPGGATLPSSAATPSCTPAHTAAPPLSKKLTWAEASIFAPAVNRQRNITKGSLFCLLYSLCVGRPCIASHMPFPRAKVRLSTGHHIVYPQEKTGVFS